MADKLINGDYEKSESALIQCEYIEELLQNALLLLRGKRGKFYPDKNFGSRFAEIKNKPELYAVAYARQALDNIDGVFVSKARLDGNEIIIELLINDEKREVSVALENNI